MSLPPSQAPLPGLAPGPHAAPFIKWAGGKARLLREIDALLPDRFGRYFEPFLGGGAAFFYMRPQDAVLGDVNSELIQTFRVVRDSVEELMMDLDGHSWTSDYYYALRAVNPSSLSPVQRASRFIFLNKTGYNGLYRVNRSGHFNVPFGRHKSAPRLYDEENLRNASQLLRRADLRCIDFGNTVEAAGPGDLVYMDPPYDPLSATSNFRDYTPAGFGRAEQERLADAVQRADARGCLVLVHNSDTEYVRHLYAAFKIVTVSVGRAINSAPDKRGRISELVILNF